MSIDIKEHVRQGKAPARPVLVFDFDGTVCVGAGPVLAYAEEIARATDIATIYAEAQAALEDVRAPITVALGEGSKGYQPRDGYDLVRRLAARWSVPEETCQDAYLRSREKLADTGICSPRGLAEFLSATDCPAILATNAPDIGLEKALSVLGLSGVFEKVFFRVGKPEGLARIVEEKYIDRPMIGFGDIWEFDLAPLHELGHRTVLIDSPFAQSPEASPTWQVDNLGEFLLREKEIILA